MSWDFSTDPDFQAQLDWMNELVRREIWPLETIWRELGQDGLAPDRLQRPDLAADELVHPVELCLELGVGGEVPAHQTSFR